MYLWDAFVHLIRFVTEHLLFEYSLHSLSLTLSLSQEYYRTGVLTCPSSESIQEVREACDYLLIPFNEKTIKTNNLREQ